MIDIRGLIINKIEQEEKEKIRGNDITASQIGSCIRKLMLQYKGYSPTPFDDREKMLFRSGVLMEIYILDCLFEIVIARQEETEYRGIRGTCDAIIRDKQDNRNILIDIKSVNSQKFTYLDETKPDEGYAMQVSLYNLGLREKYNLNGIAELIYIARDDLRLMRMPIIVNKWKDKIDAKIDLINYWKAQNELPDQKKEEEIDWECYSVRPKSKGGVKVWCRYIDYCENIKKCCLAEMEKINKKKEIKE